VSHGSEAVVGVSCGTDGGVDAATDQSELASRAEQGREDIAVCGGLQLAGGGVDVDAGLPHVVDGGGPWGWKGGCVLIGHDFAAFGRLSGMPSGAARWPFGLVGVGSKAMVLG